MGGTRNGMRNAPSFGPLIDELAGGDSAPAEHINGVKTMTDLFKNAAQNENRDRTATDAIIDRALEAGYSIRVQDAHGTNLTNEQRNANAIREAIGSSPESLLHIIDMRQRPLRYITGVTISHAGEKDTIRKVEPCAGREDEAAAITDEPSSPTPILDEIADYSDQLADEKRQTAGKQEAAGGFPSWIDYTESRIINKLYSAILKAGYQARIFDGEQTVCHWTSSRKELQRHTAQTEQTTLHIREGRKTESPAELPASLGTITLIHGNGEDVISDCSFARRDDNAAQIILNLCDQANA